MHTDAFTGDGADGALLGQPLLYFAELFGRLPRGPGGRRVHLSTLCRWRTRGVRGVRLAAVRVGSRWASSLAAVEQFILAVTLAGSPPAATPPPPAAATRRVAAELDREGL